MRVEGSGNLVFDWCRECLDRKNSRNLKEENARVERKESIGKRAPAPCAQPDTKPTRQSTEN